MKLTATVLALAVFGSQLSALSCLPPNIAQDFNQNQEAEDVYRIFVGTLKMVGPIPKYREGKERTAKAVAKGQFLGRNKLSDMRSLNVNVNAICYASWCGGFPRGETQKTIMFLRKTPKGDVLDISPCGSGFGQPATRVIVKTLQRCLRRGKCSEGDLKKLQIH